MSSVTDSQYGGQPSVRRLQYQVSHAGLFITKLRRRAELGTKCECVLCFRSGVVKALPSLRLLDGESLENAVAASCVKTIFYPICHAQITAQNDLLARHKGEIE